MISCRICNFSQVIKVGEYQPYKEFIFIVYECPNCGCRFVWRDENIHELLHHCSQSPYASHRAIVSSIKTWFDQGNLGKMHAFLTKTAKNKFIIDTICGIGSSLRILEVGCSLGYMSAYHLLDRHEVVGVDISFTAVKEAKRLFGDHFHQVEDDNFLRFGTFDVAFHAGTIGCVENPIRFTQNILAALRPGGKLLFNAPNLAAAKAMNAIWVKGTPPPDLITIFSESFWSQMFSGQAEAEVLFEPYDGLANTSRYLEKFLRKPYVTDHPELSITHVITDQSDTIKSRIFQRLSPLLQLIGSFQVIPRHSLEYGMFIVMTNR